MNPAEIYEALAALAAKPYDPVEFPFDFALATGNAPASIVKLRGGTFNKSDLPGGVLMNQKFHFAPAEPGAVEQALEALRESKRTTRHKPAILIATDGVDIAALHLKSGEPLHCAFSELGDRFGFFLPAAGKERYRAAEENPVDVKVAGRLAKLYDALIRKNPDWAGEARQHEMNQLMTRLIFCMFAEDVGIFPEDQFSRLIFTHAGDRGEGMREVLIEAFTAMNTPTGQRGALPAWTRELEYVNGGLFAGPIDAPVFDAIALRYLKDVCAEKWTGINPDIFGSMIQSVANAKLRSELGMHYTSVPNILKVLGPLFLDEIDEAIDAAWDKPRAMRALLKRLSKIRVFDPACGSGNFLVVAYREMRQREIRILSRLAELDGGAQIQMWSAVPIQHFYGIELTDFGAETAKLALFIAEYQANAHFKEVFGQKPADLPLKDAANIVCGNALRLDWEQVCPPPDDGGEVFIAGNPPFVWSNDLTPSQKSDMALVLSARLKSHKTLDYVSAWYVKATDYLRHHGGSAVLVATNAICQGQPVPILWPYLISGGVEIAFAYRPFKWGNNASGNATVDVVIVGFRRESQSLKYLIDGDVRSKVTNISPYIVPTPNIIIEPENGGSIFGLHHMPRGNMPIDGGNLILNDEEKTHIVSEHPEAARFIKRFLGADEVIKDTIRWCLFINDEDLAEARSIPPIRDRIEATRRVRLGSADAGANAAASRPHQFREHRIAQKSAIVIPAVSSERRPYLTPAVVGSDAVSSNRNYVLYDAPEWCLALASSSLHRIWIMTVCGKLQARPNYSNTMGWNTFPVPKFTEDQLATLTASAMAILRCRYGHYPATIAELYDPDKMPDDLRAVHKANDDLLESMYIGRPFRNDTERLEHLFKLYAARVKRRAKVTA